jgi:hypothetical protein
MLLRIASLGLYVCVLNFITLTFAAEPSVARHPSMRVSAGQLRFDVPDIGLLSPDQAGARTRRLLAIGSSVPEYDCRLSQTSFNTILPLSVEFDTPFRDILLDVPVHGQVHAKGMFRIVLAPDRDHASFDLKFAGKMRMIGTGYAHGVRVDSAFTTEFHGSKRIHCDRNGLRYLPSLCTARSSITIQAIKNVRPRVLGRIYERLAHRHAHATAATAEQECSQHVEHGIRVFMDQYVAALAEKVTLAFNENVRGLTAVQKIAWQQVRFRTEQDRLIVVRGPVDWSPFAGHDLTGKPLVIALPRTWIGQSAGLLLPFLGKDEGTIAPPGTPPSGLFEGRRLRFSVEWGAETIFLSFEM